MNPTQTRAKPPKGPSAMKTQMPPSMATLIDNASNSVMVSPMDLVLHGDLLYEAPPFLNTNTIST